MSIRLCNDCHTGENSAIIGSYKTVELLLPDDLLREYPGCTLYQIAHSIDVPAGVVGLKRDIYGKRYQIQ